MLLVENLNPVWQGDYFSFGNVNETVNTVENNLRFPGQYFDTETGFYYNFHRYYAPDIGRYLREDPEGEIIEYSYADDEPVMGYDILGLQYVKSGTGNVDGYTYKWGIFPHGTGGVSLHILPPKEKIKECDKCKGFEPNWIQSYYLFGDPWWRPDNGKNIDVDNPTYYSSESLCESYGCEFGDNPHDRAFWMGAKFITCFVCVNRKKKNY